MESGQLVAVAVVVLGLSCATPSSPTASTSGPNDAGTQGVGEAVGPGGAHDGDKATEAGADGRVSRFELACLKCALDYKGCVANQGRSGAIQPPPGETCESERESCMVRTAPKKDARDGGASGVRFADCPR